jgi:hypothetical protein
MTNNKIKVKETSGIELYHFEGSLEDVIAMLQDFKNEGKWEGIELDEYYESCSYQLYKHREETDKEYDKRMKLLEKEKAEKVKAKERRRKEYEKLRKEFEDT